MSEMFENFAEQAVYRLPHVGVSVHWIEKADVRVTLRQRAQGAAILDHGLAEIFPAMNRNQNQLSTSRKISGEKRARPARQSSTARFESIAARQ